VRSVRTALIGYTGFVGSNLAARFSLCVGVIGEVVPGAGGG
jgi:hypothetical protein